MTKYQDTFSRSRNPTRAGALAMLRNTLLFMHKKQDSRATRPGFTEDIVTE
jgi:hypothetical protein